MCLEGMSGMGRSDFCLLSFILQLGVNGEHARNMNRSFVRSAIDEFV